MTVAPPTPTDTLITDLRFDLVTNPDRATKRAHLGEHVADHITSAVLLATSGDAEGVRVCSHAALLADVTGYAGLTLVDRAQAAGA